MLKKIRGIGIFMILLTVCFTACDDSGSDSPKAPGSGEKVVTTSKIAYADGTSIDTYVYFSCRDGEIEPSDESTDKWDLRFAASRYILTNSGVTATELSSGGQGGIAFTGGTDFSASVDTSISIIEDYTVYTAGHGGSVNSTKMNPLSFPGYSSGDGTQMNPYKTEANNAQQYYSVSGMPPAYTMTNRVYLLRSGDGTYKAKIQIKGMEYSSKNDTPDTGDKTTEYSFVVNYEILD